MAGGLEEEPLDHGVAVVLRRGGEPALRVVPLGEVKDDGAGLPNREIAVVVVDERRGAPVRVVLGVRGGLVLALVEFEEDGVEGEPELLEHDGYFPVGGM